MSRPSCPDRRSIPRRVALCLVNLIVPGAGMLRLGRWRAGLIVMLAPALEAPSLRTLMLVAGMAAAALAVVVMVSTVRVWRASGCRGACGPWSRWYAIVGAAIVATIAVEAAGRCVHRLYRPVAAPSDAMAPTFRAGDRLVADMRGHDPQRGDVLLIERDGRLSLFRVAAFGGERMAMVAGVPTIDGRAARQGGRSGETDNTGITERLPGEAYPHRILPANGDVPDDMPDRRVPAGHIFLLGDNRGSAADSRVPPESNGLGMVPLSAVRGRIVPL